MKREDVARILEDVRAGQTSVEQALEALAYLPFADFGDIKLDLHREMRTGVPEVIYAPGKTARQIAELVQRLGNRHPVFITKADPTVYEAVKEVAPASYYEKARIV
ncbi:MAG: 1-(5-phosphoribosyl)-5-amino-4-imidazole-carboxylate carboxylase, partial [Candidatus Thermoplasmatota archaeon]|nr:1-(5-phosphoribosyl)-5-amino-4-imidazole-carboxylate carboxylase [Candidatus Thermoplasmatota archaeon]